MRCSACQPQFKRPSKNNFVFCSQRPLTPGPSPARGERSNRWTAAKLLLASGLMLALVSNARGEDWLQWKYDSRHSGNAVDRRVGRPLGLVGAVPLGDAVLTAPVICDGRIYVVDAAGTAFCIDAGTLAIVWKHATRGGNVNCNNVSSPALAEGRLHFGTMAGWYHVLDAASGRAIREIPCGEAIFSTPVVHRGRVYFATLGGRVYALQPDGQVCWTWDFAKRVLKFPGDRWSGGDWLSYKKGRVTWRDQFCCPIDMAADGARLIVPCGGRIVALRDVRDHAELDCLADIPEFAGNEYPGLFGLSIGEDGGIYVQWHRRDNSGRVEIIKIHDGKVKTDYVRGTQTAISLPGLMSFCSVSLRGSQVFRCRPEQGLGFCRHWPGEEKAQPLDAAASIAPPILAGTDAIYGGLDGRLHVVPLQGNERPWSFATPFGRPITAPVAVADGRIAFGGEDGYLYVLGPRGNASPPATDLGMQRIRSPLSSKLSGPQFDWFTNYGDLGNTNANAQGVKPPLRMKWIRRYEGTFKHLPVFGGGRMYMHTAEGQIIAVEQETGRLLWRSYFPHVYLSFTAPLYLHERLLVPQAGLQQSRLRCLDASTGRLLWEAPFSGSPSWSRQGPPVVWKNVVLYGFGSGRYAAQGSAKPFVMSGKPEPSPDGAEVMSWIYGHDNPYYPEDNRPLLRAWDLQTGKQLWTKDFAALGSGGNDCGLCLLGDTLYYSTFFGYAAKRRGQPGPRGVTMALDPATGKVRWSTSDYYVTAGCSLSGKDGRLYLGGYNKPNPQTNNRYVWCLDARNGSLIWQSEPVASAVNVITIGAKFIFTNASGRDGHLLDKATGKIIARFNYGYACTRFTFSEPYLLGANMDFIDLAAGNRLVSTGPPLEPRECVGGVVSNGRFFYTAQASGLQICQIGADEPPAAAPLWREAAEPHDTK